MVKLAKPSQIIAGGECVEALSKPMRDQTRALDKLPSRGGSRKSMSTRFYGGTARN